MTPALSIHGLCKSFDRPAVDGLDLTVRTGEFYSLLGPNGAGKTTTLRMVAGLLPPDYGAIFVCGIDARPTRSPPSDRRLGLRRADDLRQAHAATSIWNSSPACGASSRASPSGARELIDWLGLGPHAHERCEGFSKGMRQKVALAGALVHAPRVIILDEPLTGLDAGSARQVKRVLRERVANGDTVIMTTHILEVAERMADRIGVIAGGRLIAEGTLDELRVQTGRKHTSLEDTFLALVAEQQRRMSAGTLSWFAAPRAAARLARLAVDDDGRAARAREDRRDRALHLRRVRASCSPGTSSRAMSRTAPSRPSRAGGDYRQRAARLVAADLRRRWNR